MSMHKATQVDEYANARDNAKGWYETIQELVAKLKAADATDSQSGIEDARREIEEGPLSVTVRDGWRQPGSQSEDGPEEFEILLSTGGPALRILGKLNQHCEPESCELQMQDWGTPWGKWAPEPYDETFHDTLLAYASCFYFGE